MSNFLFTWILLESQLSYVDKSLVAQHLAVYENSDCPTPAVGPPTLVPLAKHSTRLSARTKPSGTARCSLRQQGAGLHFVYAGFGGEILIRYQKM